MLVYFNGFCGGLLMTVVVVVVVFFFFFVMGCGCHGGASGGSSLWVLLAVIAVGLGFAGFVCRSILRLPLSSLV